MDKLSSLREASQTPLLLSNLDDIAWVLNLRSSELDYIPIFTAYLMIDAQTATLYVAKGRIPDAIATYLETLSVTVRDYD